MLGVKAIILPFAALALTACATSDPLPRNPDGALRARPPADQCDASGVQDHLGHTASAESGAALLRLTGARQLRWAPPRSAMTMDYRPDRLTVAYDDDLVIQRVVCG